MNREVLFTAMWLVIGSCIVVFGGALTAVNAFDRRYPLVFLGFLLFTVGYRLMQYGVHERPKSSTSTDNVTDRGHDGGIVEDVLDYGLAVAGIAVAAYGGMVGAQTALDPNVTGMVLSGALIVLGYVIGHIGVNDAYI